jgi:hypothetical protein
MLLIFLPAAASCNLGILPYRYVASARTSFEMVLVSCVDSSSLSRQIKPGKTCAQILTQKLSWITRVTWSRPDAPRHQAILGLPVGLFQGNNQHMMVIESLQKVRIRLEMAEQARGASRGSKLTPPRQNYIAPRGHFWPKGHNYLLPGSPISHIRASRGRGCQAMKHVKVSWSELVCSTHCRHW